MTTPRPPHLSTRLPVILLIGLFLLVVIQRAWMADDAFITLRTVDNFVAGRGLVYNLGERAQSYTHPLWLFLLSVPYFLTREPFYGPLALSILVSLAAVLVLAFGLRASRRGLLLALSVLILSGAYVDYSTSGLENPLTHLLLIVFLTLFLRLESSPRKLFWLSLVAGLGVVNRMDAGLLFLPVLVYEFFRTPASWKRRIGLSAAGMLPFILWELFSLVYYGFLVPNTVFAKLGVDASTGALWQQGAVYLLNALRFDPVTVLAIAAGLVAALFSGDLRLRLIALGGLLYLFYVLNIGGDFMAGRFLTAPLLCLVVIIAVYPWEGLGWESFAVVFGALIAVGLLSPLPTLRATRYADGGTAGEPSAVPIDDGLVVNERLFHIDNNLAFASRVKPMPANGMRFDGVERRFNNQAVEIWRAVGMRGYYAGPSVHVIDNFALLDPLMARLPPIHREVWRVGHIARVVPDGYWETLATGGNRIADPALAEYWERLSVVTRGRLWSLARWREIWRFNTGYYDDWIDAERYGFPELTRVDEGSFSAFHPAGTALDDPGVTAFKPDGLDVALAGVSHASDVELSVDGNARYVLWFLNGQRVVGKRWLEDTGGRFADQLVLYQTAVPEAAVAEGFDRVRLIPYVPAERHALGHLRLLGPETWPGCGAAGGCAFSFGDERLPDLLRDGWSAQESWGVWNDGPASALVLYLRGGQDYRLAVRAFPFERLCDQVLTLRLNGQAVGAQSFAGCGESELVFDLPGWAVRQGANELRFEYSRTAAPDGASGDLRQLAAGFIRMNLTPADGK